ncbi:hypothetical protein QJQ45_010274 [Haematococcus lacustris]|nr:hypothetical protein QJQ45_010274 [Haematococcus lacustris]
MAEGRARRGYSDGAYLQARVTGVVENINQHFCSPHPEVQAALPQPCGSQQSGCRAIFVEDLMQEVALTANKITAMYSGPSPFSALDFPELTAFTNVAGPGSCLVYNGSGHLALQPHKSGSMTVQSDEADSDSGGVPASDFQQHVDSAKQELAATADAVVRDLHSRFLPPKHAKGLAVVYAHYWDKQPSDEDFLERLAIVKARYCMDTTLANGQLAPALLEQQKLSAIPAISICGSHALPSCTPCGAAANPAMETTKL